jgi:DNA uptake protein ComE-like DNA-binding protein
MAKAVTRGGQPRISTKLHRHSKKLGHSSATLRDIQRSLSGIGVSLSKRVIEEREKQ